jgi:hypothetical protein
MKKRIPSSLIFLLLVIFGYLLLYFINLDVFQKSITMFLSLLFKFSYVFVIIITLMFLSNYYIKREFILQYFNTKGIIKWLFVIFAGILSTGPLYV